MGEFIQIDGGSWINTAHVVEAAPIRTAAKYQLFDAEHRSLGVTYEKPETWGRTIVPAAPGTMAMILSADAGGTERPDEVYVEAVPVLAWRIDGGSTAEPVFYESETMNEKVFLPLGDDRWCAPYLGSFATLEEAKAYVLSDARANWDRNHQIKPP